jgi:hypothetical protein
MPAPSTHRCAVPGCESRPLDGRPLCSGDWRAVPRKLRQELLAWYAPGREESPEYRQALGWALATIEQHRASAHRRIRGGLAEGQGDLLGDGPVSA